VFADDEVAGFGGAAPDRTLLSSLFYREWRRGMRMLHNPAMNIQILGAGSFGITLACHLAQNDHAVRLWCRNPQFAEALARNRRAETYLPGIVLPDTIAIENTVDPGAELAVFAVPSHGMRAIARQFSFGPQTLRVSVAKGIEHETCLRMSEVLEAAGKGGPVAALSGPSHAEEVAHGLPVSVVAAARDMATAEAVQQAFFTPTFRVYSSTDLVGVELGGALKNVIAIAAGTCDGFGLGDSAKAALITRGLAEMVRLGEAAGASSHTFAGLSGMGDLIVTCMSRHSRNRAVGEKLAHGLDLETVQSDTSMVAEGIRTARSAWALAEKLGVEMPITEAVYRVLYENENPLEALSQLLTRGAKPERGGY